MSDRRPCLQCVIDVPPQLVVSNMLNEKIWGNTRRAPEYVMAQPRSGACSATGPAEGDCVSAAWRIPNGKAILAAALGLLIIAVGWMASGAISRAGEQTLRIVDAWVPATDKVGADLPLLLTIRNEAKAADALLRVRCPVANFSERHTVDRGEGAPAMRAIASIPLAGDSTLVLKRDGYHVMLLQTRQPLAAGERFTCSIAFQKAGTIETEVTVRNNP